MASTVSHPNPSAQAHAIADLTGYEDAATLRWQQACVQAANTLTALPNGRYVNVRMERMRQGLELAQRGAVTLPEDGEQLSAVVRSGHNVYQVDTRLLTCTCADYQKHLQACKHLLAVEIHLGALGLAGGQRSRSTSPAHGGARALNTACHPPAPSTASWPISEAPASLNIKLKIGNMELMFTMRDVDDLKLQRRATMSLPWLQESCTAAKPTSPPASRRPSAAASRPRRSVRPRPGRSTSRSPQPWPPPCRPGLQDQWPKPAAAHQRSASRSRGPRQRARPRAGLVSHASSHHALARGQRPRPRLV